MIITFNLKDDEDFKQQVKVMVKDTLKGIAREEAQTLLGNEFNRIVTKYVEELNGKKYGGLESKLDSVLRNIVETKLDLNAWRDGKFVKEKAAEFIKEIIPAALEKKVNFATIIDDVKKEIVKKLLDK